MSTKAKKIRDRKIPETCNSIRVNANPILMGFQFCVDQSEKLLLEHCANFQRRSGPAHVVMVTTYL